MGEPVLVVEYFREKLPDGSHGDVHLRIRERGTVRIHYTACGLPTDKDMRSLGTPFRGWTEVLCGICAEELTI